MCLAIPFQLSRIEGARGWVKEPAGEREIRLDFIEEAQVGQYVLIHAGYALQLLDEREARETIELVEQAYPHLDVDPSADSKR